MLSRFRAKGRDLAGVTQISGLVVLKFLEFNLRQKDFLGYFNITWLVIDERVYKNSTLDTEFAEEIVRGKLVVPSNEQG